MEAIQPKQIHIGLGEAIQRIMKLEHRMTCGFASEHDHEERLLLLDALNQTTLDLGFGCNRDDDLDDAPGPLEVFAKSAATSCCRIVPTDQSRNPSRRAAPDQSRRAPAPTVAAPTAVAPTATQAIVSKSPPVATLVNAKSAPVATVKPSAPAAPTPAKPLISFPKRRG